MGKVCDPVVLMRPASASMVKKRPSQKCARSSHDVVVAAERSVDDEEEEEEEEEENEEQRENVAMEVVAPAHHVAPSPSQVGPMCRPDIPISSMDMGLHGHISILRSRLETKVATGYSNGRAWLKVGSKDAIEYTSELGVEGQYIIGHFQSGTYIIDGICADDWTTLA